MHCCKSCNYFTTKYANYKSHLKSKKHSDQKLIGNIQENMANNAENETQIINTKNVEQKSEEIDSDSKDQLRIFRCELCDKTYHHSSSFCKHKHKCHTLENYKHKLEIEKVKNKILEQSNNIIINNTTTIGKVEFLNNNFTNVIDMGTFINNYSNKYGLTKEQTETLLYNYQNSGINSCINSLIFYLKKSGILQYKDIFGEEISMKDIILPFLLSDQSMRCHFEKCNDKWNKTTSTESINQLINITDDHIYKHQKQYLALNGLEKKKLINGVLRSTSYSALSEISNPDIYK